MQYRIQSCNDIFPCQRTVILLASLASIMLSAVPDMSPSYALNNDKNKLGWQRVRLGPIETSGPVLQ